MHFRPFPLATLSFCALAAALCQMAPGPPQAPRQTSSPLPSAQPAMPGAQNPFLGGLRTGQASSTPIALTLRDAIQRGLRQNLGLVLGEQGTRTAEAARLLARSGLLPYLTATTSDTSQQINLAAFGFNLPGINPIVGPFNVFDARLAASQPLLNFAAIFNARAGSQGLQAARSSYQDARDVVVLVVAGLYLQAGAGEARIEAAQAQFNTAEALYRRAVDMKSAGMVAGIDVLRAQVEMQAQQQRVIFFRNEFEKQKLSLARAIGLPLAQPLTLADRVAYTPPPPLTVEQALERAYQNRADYRSAGALVGAAESARRAAEAARLPSLTFDANYGAIGPRPWNSHGTYAASLGLTIPIFQAGRVRANVLEADALLEQRRAQLEDLRAGVEQDVRTAFLDLTAAGDQVQVARSAADLAGQQLKQSEDRFAAGVANNIEVVQSQESVATANENYISALFAYNLAKASLARALGGAENNYLQFLGGSH
jgi:outer membrane protein TolC